jgi:3-deoxy-D-manno-octulosonic-acid transferase
VQVEHERHLEDELRALFADPARRASLGNAARAIMDANHGARERTLGVIADLLPPASVARGRAFRVVK